ncbi:14873_t:CDS:2, partial [Racocetra persica]
MRDRSVSPPESRYMAPKRTTCTDCAQDQTSNPKKQEAHQQEDVTYVSTISSNEKGLTGELITMMLSEPTFEDIGFRVIQRLTKKTLTKTINATSGNETRLTQTYMWNIRAKDITLKSSQNKEEGPYKLYFRMSTPAHDKISAKKIR